MALHPFVIEAGLKSQKEFEKKFKTEEDFFSQYPHMRPKVAANGYTLDAQGNTIDENGNVIPNPNAVTLNTQPSPAWQVQNPNSQETINQVYSGNQVQPAQGQSMGAGIAGFGMQAAKSAGQAINGAINALPSIISNFIPTNHNVKNRPLPLGYDNAAYGTGSNTMFANGGALDGNPIQDVQVEGNAIKPISPSFSMIGGNFHSEGGTDVAYNGQTVEMQKNEPITKTADGSVVAFGKMRNPLTGKLFENDAKALAKEENKVSKISTKADELLQSNTTLPYQAIKYNSGTVLSDAAKIKQKEIDTKKEIFSELQDNILQIADESGQKPKKVAESIKFAKNGVTLPKYKKGGKMDDCMANGGAMKYKTVTKNQNGIITTEEVPVWDEQPVQTEPIQYSQPFPAPTNPKKITYEHLHTGNQDVYSPVFSGLWNNHEMQQAFTNGAIPSNYNGTPTVNYANYQDLWNGVGQNYNSYQATPSNGQYVKRNDMINITQNMGKNSLAAKLPYFANGGTLAADGYEMLPPYMQTGFSRGQQILNPDMVSLTPAGMTDQNQLEPIDTFADYQPTIVPLNTNSPSTIPIGKQSTQIPSLADRNKLNFASLAPEIGAVLDKPDYVQGQYYTPDLTSPYRVSFQDQINQNQNNFAQIEKSVRNNPEALSSLASNIYDANNRVQAEEFRTNQGIANQVNNQNVAILNDAKKQNISLADQQYDRQAQALANTKANREAALNSISAKFLQNKAENNKIRLMESMSNFRTDDKGNVLNENGVPVYNYNGGGQTQTTSTLDKALFTRQDGTLDENAYNRALNAQQSIELQKERLAFEKQRQAQKTSSWFSNRKR